MICFSIPLLVSLGANANDLRADASGHGLALSNIFSFGGRGGGGYDRATLEAEPAPRGLLLVGMSDRYGEAERLGAVVQEICTTDFAHRAPTDEERDLVVSALVGCRHPMANAIADLFALPLPDGASAAIAAPPQPPPAR